ncbi:phosphoglycolate phosphatase [Pseudooceanicola sp. MF1-13]|uniref:phosphoglycolate phosphatase n=1 Tax=Pseudooceanicola sp. MF1-13 TaxID=3379095 RepID=UPI0038917C4F
MAKPVVAFDLDGTLIDSAPDIHALANQVLADEGAAPLTMGETRSFIGQGAAHFIAQMRAARDIPNDEQARLLAAFMAGYDGAVAHTIVFPGVVSALEALMADGITLAICTNKPERPTATVLEHFGLARFFRVVIGGDTLPVRKPDAAPVIAAFDRAGAAGPRIFVGDSEIDAGAAQAAGVPFLLFTEGYRKTPIADLVHAAAFADFAELPGLVKGLVNGR